MAEGNETHLFDSYGESYAVTDYVLGYKQVIKLLSPLSGKRVLDYGTGTGKFARFMHREGAEVIGVDISREMIDTARTYEDGILYEQVKSGDLSLFPDESFDAVVANFVLCMVENDAEVTQILNESWRVLKTGGTFIMLQVNWDAATGKEFVSFALQAPENLQHGAKVTTLLKSVPPLPQHETYRSDEFYKNALERVKFKNISLTHPTLEKVPMEDRIQVSWLAEMECPPFTIISAVKN